MKFKKVLPRAPVVLSVEEHRRVVQYVGLLVAVAKRADARHVKVQCVSANKRKASEEKGIGLKQKQKNKVRKICEPCFFEQTIYPETGILKNFYVSNILISRDFNDRHHSFNIGQQHVSHYRA